jgi:hypothetical protein
MKSEQGEPVDFSRPFGLTDWRDIERFATVNATVEPQPADVYERGYRAYRSLYPALKEIPL